jgi:hypothetical protein
MIIANDITHKHLKDHSYLAKRARLQVHDKPTDAAWLKSSVAADSILE